MREGIITNVSDYSFVLPFMEDIKKYKGTIIKKYLNDKGDNLLDIKFNSIDNMNLFIEEWGLLLTDVNINREE